MLTFIEERRQRIRKAYEEGRAEARQKGREEGCREVIHILSLDPRMDALFREDPKIRERLRDLGIETPDQPSDD